MGGHRFRPYEGFAGADVGAGIGPVSAGAGDLSPERRRAQVPPYEERRRLALGPGMVQVPSERRICGGECASRDWHGIAVGSCGDLGATGSGKGAGSGPTNGECRVLWDRGEGWSSGAMQSRLISAPMCADSRTITA